MSPITGLTLLQALSSSPAPGQAGGSTHRARPVTAPYPGPSSSSSLSLTLSYDAFVDSTFTFQPLEPLVSFTTAVPGVRASTPPEIFQGTQTAEWSTTRPGVSSSSSSSSSMSLAARWRRTFSPTRSALPSEATRSLSIGRKGKDKADRNQDALSSSQSPSSSSVLGKQIAKLGQFFSKSKARKKKEEEKGKGKGKEEKDRDKKEKQRPASTPAVFAFRRATEYPYSDSQEGEEGDDDEEWKEEEEEEEEDERHDAQPGPSGSGSEVQGDRSGSSGSDDKIELLVEETDLNQIDTPIARRFL